MKSFVSCCALAAILTGCLDERRDPDPVEPAPDVEWLVAPGVNHLAADATHLYFVLESNKVARVALDGAPPVVETLYTVAPMAVPSPQSATVEITAIAAGATSLAFTVTHGVIELEPPSYRTVREIYSMPKAGGTAIKLESSGDSRAYGRPFIEGGEVVYSFFTSLLRRPLGGGAATLIGQSHGTWISAAVATDGQFIWAEEGALKRTPSDFNGYGAELGNVPGAVMDIRRSNDRLIVTFTRGADRKAGFVELDSATGSAMTSVAETGAIPEDVEVSADAVWVASVTEGLVHVARGGAEPKQILAQPSYSVVDTSDAVFVATETGITRIPHGL